MDQRGRQPLWRHVYAELKRRIDAGEYPPDQVMPSKRTTAQEFGVAENTVEKALKLLKAEGVIEGVRGVGTFVIPEAERGSKPSPPGQ